MNDTNSHKLQDEINEYRRSRLDGYKPPRKVYIAGKVDGVPMDVVKDKFQRLENELLQHGHTVYNPVKMFTRFDTMNKRHKQRTWEDEMKFLIPTMLQCDELHLMHDWQEDKRTLLLRDIAVRLNITIVNH